MVNRLERGMDRLAARFRATGVESVTYIRGATTLTNVPAVIGKTTFTRDDGGGVGIKVESRDFLITPTDLGALSEPEERDEIRETGGDGVVRMYRVTDFGGGGRRSAFDGGGHCWMWTDTHHNKYRIHTKYVKVIT